jgi:hypothetical protein
MRDNGIADANFGETAFFQSTERGLGYFCGYRQLFLFDAKFFMACKKFADFRGGLSKLIKKATIQRKSKYRKRLLRVKFDFVNNWFASFDCRVFSSCYLSILNRYKNGFPLLPLLHLLSYLAEFQPYFI